jgi:hypothetical protein
LILSQASLQKEFRTIFVIPKDDEVEIGISCKARKNVSSKILLNPLSKASKNKSAKIHLIHKIRVPLKNTQSKIVNFY